MSCSETMSFPPVGATAGSDFAPEIAFPSWQPVRRPPGIGDLLIAAAVQQNPAVCGPTALWTEERQADVRAFSWSSRMRLAPIPRSTRPRRAAWPCSRSPARFSGRSERPSWADFRSAVRRPASGSRLFIDHPQPWPPLPHHVSRTGQEAGPVMRLMFLAPR